MVLPDRLEGAVYGSLLAAGDMGDDAGTSLLDELEVRLAPGSGPRIPGAPSAVPALAPALVLRDAATPTVIEAAAHTGGFPATDPSTVASAVLYALVVRHLLAGERNRRSVLARARREIHEAGPDGLRRSVATGLPGPFAAAWAAFGHGRRPTDGMPTHAGDAVERAGAETAAILGGLVGAFWGSSAIPPARRRTVPSPTRARRLVDTLIETDHRAGRTWQTSTSSPLAVHAVNLAGLDRVAGTIGITPLPGRRYVAYHTGAHWRDPDTDARRLRELGTDLLLLLVEDRELVRCRVTDIASALRDYAIDLVRHPIRDPLLPRDGKRFQAVIAEVLADACRGRRVVVACRGGFDRAGMTAACLLREAGLDAATSIERVQRARPGALTLPDQQAYVRAWPPSR
jgi:hypothetical protein